MSIFKRIFGSRNDRALREMAKIVEQIGVISQGYSKLTDTELRAKTEEFRTRLAKDETLDQLLPEAFAAVREASHRTLNMRHFDMQLIGGIVLHRGKIAEMRTGEGKTLAATLPVYLNALTGKGVHVVTVNDYLAKRDAAWMTPVYEFLGLTVGVNVPGLESNAIKRIAYQCDVTYGTNNEFGFDYLRDNMAFSTAEKVQRQLSFAIVDEVDSILIDEARTPLIISGAAQESAELYTQVNKLVPQLQKQAVKEGPGDFSVDEKQKQAYLTEAGHEKVERLLVEVGLLAAEESLYDLKNIRLLQHLTACLRANVLFHRDVDYIVRQDEVLIVDEHTGRTLEGRRWSDGLHQAIEAKESVRVQDENQTLATITFQNYFRLYEKLAGMTGTADTEAYEFQQIYGLEVLVIPTNKTMIRQDHADKVYLTIEGKFRAVIQEIKECRERQQPVLVGTASIEASEHLSGLLKKENIPHQVLNAKFHAQEAQIIAEAGRPGSVTIATNMAGRGTDIVLGGNLEAELVVLESATLEERERRQLDWQQRHDQVIKAGGLHIIGSERHESRRIDNQLRGRAGRQGDPGSSRFYLSLQDNLMRIFASERVSGLMQRLGMRDDEPIEHMLVTRAIENAQRKVENYNFDLRKQLLEFDDVANEQRKVIYAQRSELMEANDLTDVINAMREEVLDAVVALHIPPHSLEEQWDVAALELALEKDFGMKFPVKTWLEHESELDVESLQTRIQNSLIDAYRTKESIVGAENLRQLEKSVLLQVLDTSWREHLSAMEQLRQSIHLRGYAQKNPKQEYKREAFHLFSAMLDHVKQEVISLLSRLEVRNSVDVAAVEEQRRAAMATKINYQHHETNALCGAPEVAAHGIEKTMAENVVPFERQTDKVGRNQECPCGSGKKYKHCHGMLK